MATDIKKTTILVIEDNEMFRKLALDMLNEYKTYSAVSESEGIKSFNMYKPDITFIDIGLPDGSGHKVVRNIIEIDPKAFIVMLTASNLENDVQESLKNGARGYIVKPFSRQKIKECIDQYQIYFKKLQKSKKY